MKKPPAITVALLITTSLLSMAATSIENPVPDQQQDKQQVTEALVYSEGVVKILPLPFPQSFNCFINPSRINCHLFSLLYESMLKINEATQELEPNLASDWSISEDGTMIDFKINNSAYWSDLVPVTAIDILFSLTMIMHPGSPNFGKKIDYMRFEAEIISENVIRFTTNDVDWRNLPLLGFMHILPAHAFRDIDVMQVQYDFKITSGQYVIETVRKGSALVLKQNDNWWKKATDNTQSDRIIWVFSNEPINMPYCEPYTDIFRNDLWDIQPDSYGPENSPFGPYDLEGLYSPSQLQHMRELLDFFSPQEDQVF